MGGGGGVQYGVQAHTPKSEASVVKTSKKQKNENKNLEIHDSNVIDQVAKKNTFIYLFRRVVAQQYNVEFFKVYKQLRYDTESKRFKFTR